MLNLDKKRPFYGYHYRGSTFDCCLPEGIVKAKSQPDIKERMAKSIECLLNEIRPGR